MGWEHSWPLDRRERAEQLNLGFFRVNAEPRERLLIKQIKTEEIAEIFR